MAFTLDAEVAHEKTLKLMNLVGSRGAVFFGQTQIEEKYSTRLKSMKWTFPVGLAAGLDKNAEALNFLSHLYFGAIEVGTITPRPQEGNPKPRLFRLQDEESLLNRMGFNNIGAEKALEHLLKSKLHKSLGVNIGKNKDTPENKAIEDYRLLYQKFAEVADYIVINISSPNTPGLRDLQNERFLNELFTELKADREKYKTPLFVKISPDTDFTILPALINCFLSHQVSGVIATNTTIMRERGEGGVSGKLLAPRARDFRRELFKTLNATAQTEMDVIGVGGISSYDDLVDFWQEGGSAVQIYSAFIYQGPNFLKMIKSSIEKDFTKYQVKNLEELTSFYQQAKKRPTEVGR